MAFFLYISNIFSSCFPRLIDVIVVSLASGSKKLGHYLDRVYEGQLHISMEIVDDNCGTAQALARIKDKIKVHICVIQENPSIECWTQPWCDGR
jgi:hypothetical protein